MVRYFKFAQWIKQNIFNGRIYEETFLQEERPELFKDYPFLKD